MKDSPDRVSLIHNETIETIEIHPFVELKLKLPFEM